MGFSLKRENGNQPAWPLSNVRNFIVIVYKIECSVGNLLQTTGTVLSGFQARNNSFRGQRARAQSLYLTKIII